MFRFSVHVVFPRSRLEERRCFNLVIHNLLCKGFTLLFFLISFSLMIEDLKKKKNTYFYDLLPTILYRILKLQVSNWLNVALCIRMLRMLCSYQSIQLGRLLRDVIIAYLDFCYFIFKCVIHSFKKRSPLKLKSEGCQFKFYKFYSF